MNGTFTFVFLLVCVVMGASVIKTWLAQKNSRTESDEYTVETLGKLEQLEERIRVLERIVTENRVDLKQQINDL